MDLLNIVRNLCAAVTKSPTKVAFVAIKGYTNANNETSNVLLNVGASLDNAKAKDLVFLKNLKVETLPLDSYFCEAMNKATKQVCSIEIISEWLEKARLAWITSIETPNKNNSEGQINAYTHVVDGMKMHNDSSQIYVWGMQVQKTVITKGEYKEVNHRPLTVAKDLIKNHLKHTQIRTYILKNVDVLKVNGETIEIDL